MRVIGIVKYIDKSEIECNFFYSIIEIVKYIYKNKNQGQKTIHQCQGITIAYMFTVENTYFYILN
jgi:hypothetical protein